MTLRNDILARFTGEGGTTPLFLPDLTLWHKWHLERGTLPRGWHDFTLPQAARHLNIADLGSCAALAGHIARRRDRQ